MKRFLNLIMEAVTKDKSALRDAMHRMSPNVQVDVIDHMADYFYDKEGMRAKHIKDQKLKEL